MLLAICSEYCHNTGSKKIDPKEDPKKERAARIAILKGLAREMLCPLERDWLQCSVSQKDLDPEFLDKESAIS